MQNKRLIKALALACLLARGHLLIEDLPGVGKILFGQDGLVYLSFVMMGLVYWFLFKSRGGLILRAVGDNHASAHALGYSVIGVRYLAAVAACVPSLKLYIPCISTP